MKDYPWTEEEYDEAVRAYNNMIAETDIEDTGNSFMAWVFALEWIKGKTQ